MEETIPYTLSLADPETFRILRKKIKTFDSDQDGERRTWLAGDWHPRWQWLCPRRNLQRSGPRVNLVNIKIGDSYRMTYESDLVAGLQWIYNIRVLNLSLNNTVAQAYHTSPLDAAVEILWFSGITPSGLGWQQRHTQ